MRGVKRVEGERQDVVRVALLPQLGARVRVPEHDVIRRVDGEQQVPGSILTPQPLDVCQDQRPTEFRDRPRQSGLGDISLVFSCLGFFLPFFFFLFT